MAVALRKVQDADIIRNPRPALAVLPELIRRAQRDPGIPFADVVAARQTLAYALTYDNQHAAGIAELDAVIAELARRHIDGSLLIETLRRKATILSAFKKYDDAAAIYDDIIAREERAGHRAGAAMAATLNGLAIVRVRQGKYDAGEALARRATAIAIAAPDAKPLAVGDAWRTWVVILGLSGKSDEALVEAQRSLKYIETHFDENNETVVGAMNNLSAMLADAGRYAEAEALQRRMIAIEQRQTTTQGQTMAIYLGNFGTTLMSQGKAAEAEAILRKARELMLGVKYLQRPDFLGALSLDLGNATYAQGRRDEALALYRTALAELARDAGTDHPSWAHAQAEIGKVLIDEGKPDAALDPLTAAQMVMTRRLDSADHLRLTAELLAGEARTRSGDPAGYAQARKAIAGERAVLVSAAVDPLRSALMAREREGNFLRFARLALDRGQLADAFEAVQLAQFGDLDSAGAAWAARQAAATPALAALTRDLQVAGTKLKQLQATRTRAVAAADAAAVAAADTAIADAQTRSAALLAQLATAFPAYLNLIRPEPRPLAAVQAALGAGEALVVTVPTESGDVISILATRDTARGAVSRLPPKALNDWNTRLRASIDRGLDDPGGADYDAGAAYALFNAILPPALDRTARRSPHLLVQAGGALASVPIAALVTTRPRSERISGNALRSAAWLIRRQAVSRPVSLATLGTPVVARGSLRFAAIGAPALAGPQVATLQPALLAQRLRSADGTRNFVADLPPLPAAESELRAIAGALGEHTPLMLVGANATKANLFAQDLRPYDVIAFATHGLVGGELRNLTEPALVMTPATGDGNEASGLLTASEVAQLQLDADWVILSACNTSAGEGGAAPIYTGLARAFVQAGTRSLLVSHWPLRDDVAAALTVATVRAAAQGSSRPAALRSAELALIANRSIAGAAHPASWAPLILIGD